MLVWFFIWQKQQFIIFRVLIIFEPLVGFPAGPPFFDRY